MTETPEQDSPPPRPSRTVCVTHNQDCEKAFWGPWDDCRLETLPADVADQYDNRLWRAR